MCLNVIKICKIRVIFSLFKMYFLFLGETWSEYFLIFNTHWDMVLMQETQFESYFLILFLFLPIKRATNKWIVFWDQYGLKDCKAYGLFILLSLIFGGWGDVTGEYYVIVLNPSAFWCLLAPVEYSSLWDSSCESELKNYWEIGVLTLLPFWNHIRMEIWALIV